MNTKPFKINIMRRWRSKCDGQSGQKRQKMVLDTYKVNQPQYSGRGQADKVMDRTVSAPQQPLEGVAHTVEARNLQRTLQQTKRHKYSG